MFLERCEICNKPLFFHSEQELKECNKKKDKQRQAVGRKAFSKCIVINQSNPDAVAENICRMHELVVDIAQLKECLNLEEFPYIKSFLDPIYDKATNILATNILKEVNIDG